MAHDEGVPEQVWHIRLADHLTSRSPYGVHTRCPLCGRTWAEAKRPTLDHVIPGAMGGVRAERAYVCEPCNNELGRELEGELLGPTGCLLTLASCNGWARGHLGATAPDGEEYRWTPATAKAELLRPSHRVDTSVPGRTTLNVSLPEQHVGRLDQITAAEALQLPYVQRLIRQHGPRGEDTRVEVTGFGRGSQIDGVAEISIDFPRLRRLACKVALNAGALTWGDEFVSSALADWLRLFLAAPGVEQHGPELSASYRVEELDRAYAPYLHDRVLHPLDARRLPPQVQFRPAGGGTWIGVYLLDVEMPELFAPEPFPLSFERSDMLYIELRQRPIRATQRIE